MKRLKTILCGLSLIILAIGILLFLNLFTADAGRSATLVDFETCAVKNKDGALMKKSLEECYSITPEKNQEFVFTAVITEDNYDDYIQFTPTGMDVCVIFGETEVYRSTSILPDDVVDQIISRVPIRGVELPLTVTMKCRYLGGSNAIFPPMLFTTSDMTEILPNLAWAHRSGIPAGAFASALLLLTALFLYGIVEGRPRYSLLPLIAASAILMIRGICAESGSLFLPEWMSTLFIRPGLLWLLLIAFLIYFVMNRHRARLFGWCALISAVVFAGACIISAASGGFLFATTKEYITGWVEYGEYTRPMIWINYWLQFVCLFVAVMTTVQSVSAHIAREQAFEIKAELAMENYHVLEEQSKRDALHRHEYKNQLTALKLLLEQDKTTEAKTCLAELEAQTQSTLKYTANFSVNAILQKAAARAEDLGFQLEAYARVEETLPISENDLCSFLFNLLDNAFEALTLVEDPANRRLNIRIKQRESALGIYAENTYALVL